MCSTQLCTSAPRIPMVVSAGLCGLFMACANAGAQPAPVLLKPFADSASLAAYIDDLTDRNRVLQERAACPVSDSVRVTTAGRGRGRPVVVGGQMRDAERRPLRANVFNEEMQLSVNTDSVGVLDFSVPARAMAGKRYLPLRIRAFGYMPRVRTLKVAPGDSIWLELGMCQDYRDNYGQPIPWQLPALKDHEEINGGALIRHVGRYLVVLHRGRLSIFDLSEGRLRVAHGIDLVRSDREYEARWRDEFFVHGDRITVISHRSFDATIDMQSFRIDPAAHLHRLASYQLRAGGYHDKVEDSRVLNGRLLLFSSRPLLTAGAEPLDALPAVRRWRSNTDTSAFRTIASPHRVFGGVLRDSGHVDARLHTLVSCDVAHDDLGCEADIVIGPPAHAVYGSPSAVYASLADWEGGDRMAFMLRFTVGGGAPRMIRVPGTAPSPAALREIADTLHAVLIARDWRWWRDDEPTPPPVYHERIPLDAFRENALAISTDASLRLPEPRRAPLQVRWSDSHLFYGSGGIGAEPPQAGSTIHVIPLTGAPPTQVTVPHGTGRIELTGKAALVIGVDSANAYFSVVNGSMPHRGPRTRRFGPAGRADWMYHLLSFPGGGLLLAVLATGDQDQLGIPEDTRPISFILYSTDEARARIVGSIDARPPADTRPCGSWCLVTYPYVRAASADGRFFLLVGPDLVEVAWSDGMLREVARLPLPGP